MAAHVYSVFALCLAGAIVASAGRFDFNSTGGEAEVCAGSSGPGLCPVTCFRPDPVCGEDGVTYWCGCGDAACAGAKVAKKGFCEVEKGGAGPQAMLLIHIVWLIVVGFSVVFGVF